MPLLDQNATVADIVLDHPACARVLEPKLVELANVVSELRVTLEPHLDHEEQWLFPLLVADQADTEARSKELRAMHDEHLPVGKMLVHVRALSNDHAVPEWACTSYRTLMRELEVLEADTLAHVHAENHDLLPRFEPRFG